MTLKSDLTKKLTEKLLRYKIFEPHRANVSDLYHITLSYRLIIAFVDFLGFLGISLIFYNTILPGFILSPLIIPFYDYHYRHIIGKRKNQLEHQFKDMLTSLNSALSTGYSLENATKEAYVEMTSVYGEKATICREISVIINLINLGKSVEYAYETFAVRCNVDCIITFSEILTIAKRSSGNLTSVIKSTTSTLLLKIDSDRDIKSAIASKLFERNIMIFMPIIIIAYVSLSSPGFFTPLYTTLAGRAIMTFCLIVYIFAIWLSTRIFRMEAL